MAARLEEVIYWTLTFLASGDYLWQAMSASWAKNCASEIDRLNIVNPIKDALLMSES